MPVPEGSAESRASMLEGIRRLEAWRPDERSTYAPFVQLREEIAALIAAGVLPVGLRLPTVRGLAEQVGLAANTVAKVFRELELAGLVRTAGRNGSFVSASPESVRAHASAAAKTFVDVARGGGLSEQESADIIAAAWKAVQ